MDKKIMNVCITVSHRVVFNRAELSSRPNKHQKPDKNKQSTGLTDSSVFCKKVCKVLFSLYEISPSQRWCRRGCALVHDKNWDRFLLQAEADFETIRLPARRFNWGHTPTHPPTIMPIAHSPNSRYAYACYVCDSSINKCRKTNQIHHFSSLCPNCMLCLPTLLLATWINTIIGLDT